MRILFTCLLFTGLIARAQTPQSVFVHVPGLSEKNVVPMQQASDTWPGVHYIGYCHDLGIAQFVVDRSVVPTDSTLTGLLRGIGFERCLIKSTPQHFQLQQVCTRYESRH